MPLRSFNTPPLQDSEGYKYVRAGPAKSSVDVSQQLKDLEGGDDVTTMMHTLTFPACFNTPHFVVSLPYNHVVRVSG